MNKKIELKENMQESILLFFDRYNNVFDTNGNVKLCGRDACIALIDVCNKIIPNGNYGDNLTGMMNTSNILSLYRFLSGIVKVSF